MGKGSKPIPRAELPTTPMRIISGKWRSRNLTAPSTARTRPMPDRIREAIFDILASRHQLPHPDSSLRVADLFAGSGCLGLEALSRGAAGCDFFEQGTTALGVLKQNIQDLQAQDSGRIVRGDAWTVCLTSPRPAEHYGLIFLDPPYRDTADSSSTGRVARLLADLKRAGWVAEQSIVVLHHSATVEYESNGRSWWQIDDRRVYGTNGISFITAAPDDSSTPADDSAAE